MALKAKLIPAIPEREGDETEKVLPLLSFDEWKQLPINTEALDQLELSAEKKEQLINAAKSNGRWDALNSIINSVSF